MQHAHPMQCFPTQTRGRNYCRRQPRSADPRRVKTHMGGGLPSSYPDPLAAKVGPESSIRTLYVYWGLTLVRMDQILRRRASVNFGPLVAPVRFKRIGAYFWSAWVTGAFTRKRADGSLHGKRFTLKRAEGSLHVWERNLYRAEGTLHVCGKRPHRAEGCPPWFATPKVRNQFA